MIIINVIIVIILATTKEDLRQITADVPVVMQRQVLVIQRVDTQEW